MDSSDEETNNNPLSSLTEALASATANERDKRQRKVLVERLVRRLFDTLEGRKDESKAGAVVDPTSSDGAKAASEVDAATNESSKPQRTLLVEQILAENESGSTTIANTFSSSSNSEAFRIVWNQDRPLTVHWVWQATKSAVGVTEQSSCNLSVVAKEGVAIEFYATNINADKIALCEVSKFQWTLEGSTETTTMAAGLPNNTVTLQSFWKIERATFSWSMGEVDDELKAEGILLEGTDISLIGKVMLEKDDDTTSTNTPLQLAPDAVLSLQASSVGSLGGNDQEKRRVGQALRALDSFLDTLLSKIPNLHLSIVDTNNIDRTKTTDDTKIPPFGDGETNKESSLGYVLKYYLKHYCSSSGSTPGTTVLNHSNGDNENVATAAKARLSSLGNSVANFGSKVAKGGATVAMRTTLGSAVSLAADGVAAAARKGKDIRLSQSQGQPPPTTPSGRVSLDFEGQTTANTDSEIEDPSKDIANNDEGYKFGDVARGVFGSIREKRQQAGEGSQNGSPNKKNEYVKENKGKIAGVAGGSAGAVAGLIVAGPLGAMAGSFLGSQSGSFFGSRGSKNQEGEEQKQQDQTKDGQADASPATTNEGNSSSNGASRFGDRFRTFAARGKVAVGGAMAKGKEVTGRGMTEAKGLLASVRSGSDGKSPEAPVEPASEAPVEAPVEPASEVATDVATVSASAPVASSDLQQSE